MSTAFHNSRWLPALYLILSLGLLGNAGAFYFLYRNNGYTIGSVTPTSLPTFSLYAKATFLVNTPTAFQPLPTETSTPTPTLTPTATKTKKPKATRTSVPPANPDLYPTSAPVDGLPDRALVSGVVGYAQQHTLSCEARSAVDWARFFGVSISESDFLASLPTSGNPEKGFVGNVDDPAGQIPPDSYGVHSAPVAKTLKNFGLAAASKKGYSFDDLRRQVAAGNPVITWVVGNVWYGSPVSYTAPDGKSVTVAYFEHTVIIIGYDAYGVTVVDNNLVYWRTTSAFLNSWAVLGNQVVIAE